MREQPAVKIRLCATACVQDATAMDGRVVKRRDGVVQVGVLELERCEVGSHTRVANEREA